jgi:hypothetical protein
MLSINQAAYLARDTAPDIDVVLITHYTDVETLDTVRPGDTDLQTALGVNRAVALEMLDAGVEVLVQRADPAAFRRWMSSPHFMIGLSDSIMPQFGARGNHSDRAAQGCRVK